MRRTFCLITLILCVLMAGAGCTGNSRTAATAGISTTTTATTAQSTAVASKAVNPQAFEIKIQSPMTLSNTLCTYNGQTAFLRLKMVKGRYYEDWNPGAYSGTLWEGSFVMELADEYGKTIAETDMKNVLSGPEFSGLLTFRHSFDFELDDYNNDGDPDFAIGQYGSSNGYLYEILTLRKDGKVERLPVKDRPDLFVSDRTGDYSTKLNKISGTTFEIEYHDNSVPATFHDFYQWDGKQFVLTKKQRMTQEDALAGSVQDQNGKYTFAKYGKSEDGYMEFTRTGTQISGHLEIASINQKNEVDLRKYLFEGALINNYISITFPEKTWLNSSKGMTWIGDFDSQSITFYAPVDESIDANGFSQLSFNKGTAEGFNGFVSELKDRAQEWKRETAEAGK